MRTRSLWSRRSACLTLLFHLLVVGLGPIVDARLEALAGEADAAVHVESAEAPPCSPGHRHDHCQICRNLPPFDVPSDGGARLSLPLDHDLPFPCSSRVAPRTLASLSPFGPRAPPLV